MQIGKDTVVTVQYQVWDAQGELIQDAKEPMVYLHGGYGDVFEAIETALDGRHASEEVWLQVEPEDAFGVYDPELIQVEDRNLFPEEVEVGMQFEGVPTEDEDEMDPEEESPIWTVTGVSDDKVVLDGNHPLAGIALRYHLIVSDVRAATDEEIERGSVIPDPVAVSPGSLH
jgi:FKBP-type peptidyl-prolyl cis-trans isomerase SlyD